MKKITKFSFSLLFSIVFIQACTKDRVPNPDTLNAQLGTQATIYNQNFDSASVVPPNLPGGWLAAAQPSGDTGWVTTNTNSSWLPSDTGGYDGASGKNNIDISNSSTTSGTFTLTSAGISTIGYTNISVIYGARFTSKFPLSAITGFEFSTDNGATWTNIPYTENPSDGYWHLINNGARMSLPAAAANKGSIKFRWSATLVANPKGTYRIDDFQIFGTSM